MNVNNGSLIHVITNMRSNGSLFNTNNIAINYKTYSFSDDYLLLSRNIDKICPEYIILDLFDGNIELNVLFNYLKDIYIIFEVGEQRIVDFPFTLLWNLQQPEIIDNKLYIYFPFKHFFGDIFLNNLYYHDAAFILVNYTSLANYASRCSLLCKTFIHSNQQITNSPSCNIIQQISSLEVMVSISEITQQTNEFVIKTTMFEGLIRGFFIESANIEELIELQFFINGHIRTNYDTFLIRNKCFKINNNMIFYSFNDDLLYQNRSINAYDGAFHMSAQVRTQMRLKFNNLRNKVKIYALGMNNYIQTGGVGRLESNINIYHLKQDFGLHPLITLDQIISHQSQIYFEDSIIPNNTYGSYTVGYYQSEYNIMNANNENHLIKKIIPEDKKMCGISLDEIQLNEKYMSCINCSNNFKEPSIRRWFQNRMTCPSCRSNWCDFNVYVNSYVTS
jgi:hypothetical protein